MFYVYLVKRPDGKLFYVGKGGGGNWLRIGYHEWGVRKNLEGPLYKNNIIRKILNKGKEIDYEIVLFSENESIAFDKEKELISFYGKYSDKTGILSNLTDGGDGGNGGACKGQIRSKEVRNKMSRVREGKPSPAKGYKWTDEQKKRHSEVHTGYIMSENIKIKIAESNRKTKNGFGYRRMLLQLKRRMTGESNPAKRQEVKDKISKARMGFKFSKESILKMRNSHIGKRISEETKVKMRASHRRRIYGL